MSEFHERLREARLRRGFDRAKEAREFLEIPEGTYSNLEVGSREPGRDLLVKIARRLRVNLQWLATGEGEFEPGPAALGRYEAPIRGIVGVGGEIHSPAKALDPIRLAFAIPEGLIALCVDGYAMLPILDHHDVLLVWNEQRRATEESANRFVALQTATGERTMGTLLRGGRRGQYTIARHGAPPLENARIAWVGEVYAHLPADSQAMNERWQGLASNVVNS